jgi:hypothetical protein
MYVEAICPLCFASHVVPDDMRGEKFRCEECEEEFVISKKAKRTNKKPSRLREVKAADEVEEVAPVEAVEVLPEANLVDAPPKKAKARAEDEEVLDIPDDALQGAPVVKTPPPPPKRRRQEDDEDDRPKKRPREADEDDDDRPRRKTVRRPGPPVGLVVGISAAAVLLLGLVGAGAVWVFSSKDEEKPQQAQANNAKANAPEKQRLAPPEAAKQDQSKDPPKKEPPKEEPPPPKREPPRREPPPQPQKPEPPAGPWTAKADPPATAVKMPANFKKEIPAPGVLPEVVFPSGSSAFVAIGSNRGPGDERQVWNLQTGEMVAKVVGQVQSITPPVLSSDGAHLAYQSSAKRGTVEVWAPASGKTVSVPVGSPLTPDLLDFAGPDTLLAGRRAGAGMTVKVIDVKTGKEEHEFTTPRPWGGRDAVAVSPGGAYLAVIDRENLQVFEVKSGLQFGQRPLPKGAGGAVPVCHGLSFSPDGGELAALFSTAAGQLQLVCWDAARGEVVSDMSVPKAMPQGGTLVVYRGHVIDWLGDRRGWLLYGYTMIERGKDGSVTALAEPPAFGSPNPRHLVGPGHSVTAVAAAKAGEKVLTVSPFDPDKPQ